MKETLLSTHLVTLRKKEKTKSREKARKMEKKRTRINKMWIQMWISMSSKNRRDTKNCSEALMSYYQLKLKDF